MQPETAAIVDLVDSHLAKKVGDSSRIRELDGLRGVAALMVFCHHVLFTSAPYLDQMKQPVRSIGQTAQAGAYGVDLFFVLSGFLITSILVAERSSPHYYWNFYWRRALRILPLYGALLILLAVAVPPARKYVLLSALFLSNFEHVFHLASWGPFWSLAIEEQFYLFWPRAAKGLSLKGLERLSLAVAVGSLLFRLVDALFGHSNYRFTFFHCDGLAIGAVLACQLYRLRAKSAEHSETGPPPEEMHLLLLVTIAGLFLAGIPSILPITSRAGLLLNAFRLTGVNLVAYAAVRVSVRYSGAGFLAPLRSRVLTFFGLISYALYLLHELVMSTYRAIFRHTDFGGLRTSYCVRFLVILGVTTVLAVISRYLIEKPPMRLKRYVLRGN